MCSVVLLRRPHHPWPLLLAANRDENIERLADPPNRHWPDRPSVIAGRDRLAGGSWLGLNDDGVVAALLNQPGTLGPSTLTRSRGELVLEALDHAEAEAAAAALIGLRPQAYRRFHLLIADHRDAYLLSNDEAQITVATLPDGLNMLTAHGLNNSLSPRVRRHLSAFEIAAPPDPERGDWSAWIELLATGPSENGQDGMSISPESGFATVSSALIALPAPAVRPKRPVFLHADGPPAAAVYRDIIEF